MSNFLLLYLNTDRIALGLALRPRDEDPRSSVPHRRLITIFKAAPEAVAEAFTSRDGLCYVPQPRLAGRMNLDTRGKGSFVRDLGLAIR